MPNQLSHAIKELTRLRLRAARLEEEVARHNHNRALAALPGKFGYQTAIDFLEAVAEATGVSLARGGRHQLARTSDLRRLAAAHHTAAQIARELKVSLQTVYNRCSKERIRLSSSKRRAAK